MMYGLLEKLCSIGGVSGRERGNDPANQHTLYLNATCLFGGVELK